MPVPPKVVRQIVPPGRHAAPAPQPAKPAATAVVIPTTKAPSIGAGAAAQIAKNKAEAAARPGQAYPAVQRPVVVAAKAIAAAPQGAAVHRPEASEMRQEPEHWSTPPKVAPAPQTSPLTEADQPAAAVSAVVEHQAVAAPVVAESAKVLSLTFTCPVCRNTHTLSVG